MTQPDPRHVITTTLDGYLVPARTYPQPLPPDLAPWYCYTSDGGHSIVVVPAALADPEPAADRTVPIPVRTVQRLGWETRDGWLIVNIPYDPNLGIVVPPTDDEF